MRTACLCARTSQNHSFTSPWIKFSFLFSCNRFWKAQNKWCYPADGGRRARSNNVGLFLSFNLKGRVEYSDFVSRKTRRIVWQLKQLRFKFMSGKKPARIKSWISKHFVYIGLSYFYPILTFFIRQQHITTPSSTNCTQSLSPSSCQF